VACVPAIEEGEPQIKTCAYIGTSARKDRAQAV
jgi:hypothetical protein